MKKLLLLLAIAGCQTAALPETTTEPIINGTVDNGDPAVGYVGLCTGTLVGRRTVLTAAHCVGADGSYRTFCISPCNNYYACAGQCMGGTAHVYPGYSGDGDWQHDVAVIDLTGDFTSSYGVVPRRIGSTPQTGENLYLVGFGCTYEDSPLGETNGVKRSGYNVVESVSSMLIEYDDTSHALACHGDSGGPAFAAGSDCEVGVTVGIETYFFDKDWELARTDVKASWIKSISGDSTVYSCGQTVCGDGLCQSPESCSNCPTDCGSCDPSNPCSGQPNGTPCGYDCCSGFNTCSNGVCTTGSCCNTTHCCDL